LEELDIVTAGGNYGWRVYEGTQCTNLDPGLCTPPNFVAPIAQYDHSGGRCSIIGGYYVYHGSAATLPVGTYVFGDFCSGEIFSLANGAPNLLLRTSLSISSFGEDEAGEIYVVGLGGTVQRISSTSLTATTTALTSTLNPSMAGDAVNFTATVVGSSPTGSVNFADFGVLVAGCSSVGLSGSGNSKTAVCSTSSLAVGTHSIVASYGGDAANAGSSSSALTQTVNAVEGSSNVALASAGAVASASSTYGAGYPVSAINNNERAGTNWGAAVGVGPMARLTCGPTG